MKSLNLLWERLIFGEKKKKSHKDKVKQNQKWCIFKCAEIHFRIGLLQNICFLFKFNLFFTPILTSVSYAQYHRATDAYYFVAKILKVAIQCPATHSVVHGPTPVQTILPVASTKTKKLIRNLTPIWLSILYLLNWIIIKYAYIFHISLHFSKKFIFIIFYKSVSFQQIENKTQNRKSGPLSQSFKRTPEV